MSKWQGVSPSMLSQTMSTWRNDFPALATEKLSHLDTLCAVWLMCKEHGAHTPGLSALFSPTAAEVVICC